MTEIGIVGWVGIAGFAVTILGIVIAIAWRIFTFDFRFRSLVEKIESLNGRVKTHSKDSADNAREFQKILESLNTSIIMIAKHTTANTEKTDQLLREVSKLDQILENDSGIVELIRDQTKIQGDTNHAIDNLNHTLVSLREVFDLFKKIP